MFWHASISIGFILHLYDLLFKPLKIVLSLWHSEMSLFLVRQLQIPGYSHMLQFSFLIISNWTIYFSECSRWTPTFWKRARSFTSKGLFWILFFFKLKDTSIEKWCSVSNVVNLHFPTGRCGLNHGYSHCYLLWLSPTLVWNQLLQTCSDSPFQQTKSATWAIVGISHLLQGQPPLPMHSAHNPSPTLVQQSP